MKTAALILHRIDAMEKMVRFAAMEACANYTSEVRFNLFCKGYEQALKDMGVHEKYLRTFHNVVRRCRRAYENDEE